MQLVSKFKLILELTPLQLVVCLVILSFVWHATINSFCYKRTLTRTKTPTCLLDLEFDDLDYDTLRALDSDNTSTSHSMSEEDINALPVHKYKVHGSDSKSKILGRLMGI